MTLDPIGFAWDPHRFNTRVHEIPSQAMRADPVDPSVISLAFGAPDPKLFPAAQLAEAAREALRDFPSYAVALQYGSPPGNPLLLEQLGHKLAKDEGKPVAPGGLMITNGSSQAISLAVQVLASPGATCLIETPTFMGTIRQIRFNEISAIPIPLDDRGTNLEVLEATLRRLRGAGTSPRFLYTIPTFNNPAGITMPLERRLALLDLAAGHGLPVIEDDAYRDLRYSGEPVPSLHALDTHGLVMRLGTFSKIVAPGVRLGFILADPAVIERLPPFKAEGSTNGLTSLIVATFMKSGALAEHIEVLRQEYRTRRDAMYRALENEMPEAATWTRTDGGFFVWMTLAPRVDMARVVAKAEDEKVVALPGGDCYPDGGGTHNLRLSFSLQPLDKQAEAIRRLARAIRAGL